jgi:2-(1,2-epoxy-1,2-dihydrophenyl)acetyl-CoA isomerase
MEFETLLYQRRDGVAYVTLNRPDRLNALNARLAADLSAAAQLIESDAEIRAVLLGAAGRAFCSGADLRADDLLTGDRPLGQAVGESLRTRLNPMIHAWHELGVPVVVAVNGIAAGAGVSLALIGDIVIAAQSASFTQLFAPKLGLMPDLGSTFYLPRIIGTARAKALALLGDALPAPDAERFGLIWASVPDDRLTEQAEALVRRFATGPTQAFKRIKRVFNREPAATLEEQLALEADLQTELADTRDFAEGVQAFRNKRPPHFNGA